MTTLTTNRSVTQALRILCGIGALTACSGWAIVVPWQLSPRGSLGAFKDLSNPAYTTTATGGINVVGTSDSNQSSFSEAPESQATNETGATKAAALNDKLQARDTDFQEQAPSILAAPGGAFNEQFVSVPNYQFASMALGSAVVPAVSTAGDVVPVPEMSALFPIIGLIVAVSCTRILRRRRAAQLSAARILV